MSDIVKKNQKKCYSYFNKKFTQINIDYSNFYFYQYYRYTPDYFRYVDPDAGTDNYLKAISEKTQISACLIEQLNFGPLVLYSLEELFLRLVPSIKDSKKNIEFKDCIRNQFIAFALNIEKTYLYYNKGKKTCNNFIVPWEALFNINVFGSGSTEETFSYVFGDTIPLNMLDQVIIYKLSVNFFYKFFTGNTQKPFNYYNIIKKALNIPLDTPETEVNFYTLIYLSFKLLADLFTISQTLLLGKNPGLPTEFINLYFPPERQKYYYNYYLTWIQSRNRYFGFNNEINVSNGSGTYIPVG